VPSLRELSVPYGVPPLRGAELQELLGCPDLSRLTRLDFGEGALSRAERETVRKTLPQTRVKA
jgi:hypothetical protein